MFVGSGMAKQFKRARIVLSNPPFEDFIEKERKHYKRQPGLGNRSQQQSSRVARSDGSESPRECSVWRRHAGECACKLKCSRAAKPAGSRIRATRSLLVPGQGYSKNSEIEIGHSAGQTSQAEVATIDLFPARGVNGTSKNFAQRLEPSSESRVPQSSFLLRQDTSLRLPDLPEVWEALSSCDRLAQHVLVQKGFEFKGSRELAGRVVISDKARTNWRKAYLRADDDYSIWSTPTPSWIDYSKETLRERGGGAKQGWHRFSSTTPERPETLASKATIDPEGVPVTTSFPCLPTEQYCNIATRSIVGDSQFTRRECLFIFRFSKTPSVTKEWRDFPLRY